MSQSLDKQQLIAQILAQNQQMLNILSGSGSVANGGVQDSSAVAKADQSNGGKAKAIPTVAKAGSSKGGNAQVTPAVTEVKSSKSRKPEAPPAVAEAGSSNCGSNLRQNVIPDGCGSSGRMPDAPDRTMPSSNKDDHLINELSELFDDAIRSSPPAPVPAPVRAENVKPKPTSAKEALLLDSFEAQIRSRLGSKPSQGSDKSVKEATSSLIKPFSLTTQRVSAPVNSEKTTKELSQLKKQLSELRLTYSKKERTQKELEKQVKEQKKEAECDQLLENFKKENNELLTRISGLESEIKTTSEALKPTDVSQLTEDQLVSFQELTCQPNVSKTLWFAISCIMTHLNTSREAISRSSDQRRFACATIFGNEMELPKGLKDNDVIRLKQVKLFLTLLSSFQGVDGFSNLFYITDGKGEAEGKKFVKLNTDFFPFSSDFPNQTDVKLWFIHFASVLKSILLTYNHQNHESLTLNEVLENKTLMKNVFFPHQSANHRSHRTLIPFFTDDSSAGGGACAVPHSQREQSPPRRSRGGGGVAVGGRSAQSGRSEPSDIESLIHRWRTSMGKVSGRPLAQIGTRPSSEESIRLYKQIEAHQDFKASGKKTVAKFLDSRDDIRIDGTGTNATFTVL